MERVLVTGADGFVASQLLAELSRETDWRLTGIGLKPGPSAEVPGLEYKVLDITDHKTLGDYLAEVRPDTVFHLAAQPSVARSWEDPWSTYNVNLMGQVNLMESLLRLRLDTSVHIACSSEEYGKVPQGRMPLGERMPLKPCSHYAVSKVTQELLGLMYREAFGWRVLVTRSFNQAGPGQSPDFVVSSFARQVAMIEAGRSKPVLKVGNLEARRDFTDVRDTARAYRLLMEKGQPGAVYNVCSGMAPAISEILDMLLGLSDADIEVERDPARQRPSDVPLLLGDASLIRKEIGWEPIIGLEQTLEDTLDYWRQRVSPTT
ncbi:MAG: GDP-mannose 4,6-dehydratase [Actinobacteria bacterium]|nr:GDP-mannose 4,6-dehydratase [Actinomycetota bacterium]